MAGVGFSESAVLPGPGCDRGVCGSLDAVTDASSDRRGDARSGVHVGSGATVGGGSGEGEDGRRRCDDAGSERGDAEHRAVATGRHGRWGVFSFPLYERLKAGAPEFEDITAFDWGGTLLSVRRQGAEDADILCAHSANLQHQELGYKVQGRVLVSSIATSSGGSQASPVCVEPDSRCPVRSFRAGARQSWWPGTRRIRAAKRRGPGTASAPTIFRTWASRSQGDACLRKRTARRLLRLQSCLGGRVKSGHLWTPQIRPFPASRDGSLPHLFEESRLSGPWCASCAVRT